MKGRGLYNVGLNVFTQNTFNDLSSYDIAWEKFLDENRITGTISGEHGKLMVGLIISSNITPTSLIEIA